MDWSITNPCSPNYDENFKPRVQHKTKEQEQYDSTFHTLFQLEVEKVEQKNSTYLQKAG